MKGKYITTSLILAILGNGRIAGIEVAETTAVTDGHEIIWSKHSATTADPNKEKDELKKA